MSRYILVVSLLFSIQSFGQVTSDSTVIKNTVFAEFLGPARSIISANYERIFRFSNAHFLYTFRTGIGYVPGSTESRTPHKGTITIPLVASLLTGGKAGYAQLGIGYSYSFGDPYTDSTVHPPQVFQKYEPGYSLSLGYRYMGNNIVAQAFPMLLWTNNPTNRFSVSFGFSIGTTF